MERYRIGMKAGLVGIIVNLILFIGKIIIGTFSRSSAIVADAVNNLSDFLSSIITLVGFKFSKIPADHEHPYGHARFEFISGFVIAIIMLYLGVDILRDSLIRIFNQESLIYNRWLIYILIFSMVMKLFLMLYYLRLHNDISSDVLEANVIDSRNDILISSSLLIGTIIEKTYGIRLDAWMGLLVSILITYSSIQMIRSFVKNLLGARPDEELISSIQAIFDAETEILGYHDLMVHSYGPDQYYASVHVEVDAQYDLIDAHNIIDRLEYKVYKECDVEMVIHLDPIDLNDSRILELSKKIELTLSRIDPDLSYHDVRIFNKKLIFDVVIPQNSHWSEHELRSIITKELSDEAYYIKINFDKNYLLEI